ncbi:protein RALF-like 19 [Durio zibethinus]|uniref:Protein RALF-like 19 n=1 Tax=Durio zibethinus TaxID=66656 RepID=A0A6P5XFT0_DURZI|nr:protein RALF-like 19 [Durio zibethinus]
MNIRLSFALLIIFLALSAELSSSYGNMHWSRTSFSSTVRDGTLGAMQTCHGLFGECIGNDEETVMESDISRRALAGRKRYISYGALKRDRVPCNRRGHSYYNCGAPGRANPYNRGCSVITHCYRYTG